MQELPKLRKKSEQKYTPKVLEWFARNVPISAAIEIKYTDTDTISPSELKPHQRLKLHQAKHGLLQEKIKDGGSRNVFDAFQLVNVPAYVAVYFRKHRVLLVVDIDEWAGARYNQLGYVYRVENF